MSELVDRHDAAMGDDAPMFYDRPVELVRGDGVWLFDADGRRYLDIYNNVPCVGHGNPRVAEAVGSQMATLNVHSRYLHDGVIGYAERLVGTLRRGGRGDRLESMVFTCTGSEANEVAIMTARAATGNRGVIGTDGTYHGNTPEVSKLTRLPVDVDGAESRRGVRAFPTPCRFRPPEPDLSDGELCELYLDRLQAQIDGLQASGEGVAALLLCSILANEGLPDPPTGFIERAVEAVRRAGGLVIADEVQAGFARSGRMWGFETTGFDPDIVTLGKPMGNGLPVAGVVASHELVTGFRRTHRYFNTFAASPVQAAAAGAVLDEIEDRGLVEQVAEVGASVQAGLRDLQPSHPAMGDIRGHGLFIGVDWVRPGTTEPDVEGAAAVVEAMKDRGFLMGKAGHHGNVLKVRPPLVFDHDNARMVLDGFADALAQVEGETR